MTPVDLEGARVSSAPPGTAPFAVPGERAAPKLVRLRTAREGSAAAGRRRFPKSIERLAGVVVLFVAWQLASYAGWISPKVLAGPADVGSTAVDLFRSGELADALQASLARVGWGLGVGVPIGTALALIAGLSRVGDDLVDANVQMLRFVPIIGLQPLLILWLGIGETAKVSLIVIGVCFPVYVNTYAAIRGLDPRYLELAEVTGLGRLERIRRVVLPGALPGFVVGLRMATGVAWLLLVFAEQINANSGLGFLIIRSQTFFQSDVIVVCLVAYAAFGLLSDTLVRTLERRLLRWQPGR